MAATQSTMLPLGTRAPDFNLPRPDGDMVSLDDYPDARASCVMFICNHCPYVLHLRRDIAALATEYQAQGVAFFGINSNDVERYPDDRPEKMAEQIAEASYTFPYLFDETQQVAQAYGAACTPDFFVFDADRQLTYRGQFDDSRPGNGVPPTGADLRAALDSTLAGEAIPEDAQRPSLGCGIKWKPGNEPAYAQ